MVVDENLLFRFHAIIYPEMWTGIGFSFDGLMINSDAIIITVDKDSSIAVTDQFSTNYGRPLVDQSQDIFNISTYYVNGNLYANFSRYFSQGPENGKIILEVYPLMTSKI